MSGTWSAVGDSNTVDEPIDFKQEGVLMVDDLNVTEYISNQLKPLIDRIEKLEADRRLSIQTVQPFIIGEPMCNCKDN